MNEDDLVNQVDLEVTKLQEKLKNRLKESQDLGDLNKRVFKSTLMIEEHTAELENTAVKTKWKWILEYWKWMAIAGAIGGILLLILFRLLFK